MTTIRVAGAAVLAAVSVALSAPTFAQSKAKGNPIKIAYIDPLSGAFANVGEAGLHHFRAMAEEVNAKGGLNGRPIEVVGYDNKVSPQEALNQLKRVIDDGIQYITQGNGSAVAGALIEAVNRHNERNPGKEILYLNYAAVDPAFTNEKCSFWHFRFDANSDMKMESLTTWMAQNKGIKKVYLINQDYSFGHAVKKAAREMLGRKRPDVEIVGDDLHPLGKVTDFSPYIAKMKQAGTDTVITGNWGQDMALLIKAAKDGGLNASFYTYYGGGLGALSTIGESGVGNLKQITEWHENVPTRIEKWSQDFEKKYKVDFYYLRVRTMMLMLAEASKKAKSVEPKAIAYALEGMRYDSDTGEVEMRKQDHQLIQPLYLSTVQKVAAKGGPKDVKYDVEGTGLGFKTDAKLDAFTSAGFTSCNMKRP
ncbi:MAG TPA: branched-chain amino acid ABC transporter substrate-binding protein [Burkholderiales bacterium]|nr:branched-chain amino acid ABC transporter substrate-binding protein [Burkholderiales bacterium]